MTTAKKSPRGPTSIDQHVGARLRLRRSMLEMSQSGLGDKLGITFQQIQKYERGTNRIGASRLFNLAKVLEVPVQYFFDGLEADGTSELGGQESETLYDFIASPDGLALASAFSAIKDQTVRRRTIDLLRAMATDDEEPEVLSLDEAGRIFNRDKKRREADEESAERKAA